MVRFGKDGKWPDMVRNAPWNGFADTGPNPNKRCIATAWSAASLREILATDAQQTIYLKPQMAALDMVWWYIESMAAAATQLERGEFGADR